MKTLHHNQRLLLWILSEQPQTMRELAKTSKGSLNCIKENVRDLVNKGLVYVSGEAHTGVTPARIYATHIKHPKPKQSRVKVGGPPMVRDKVVDILRDVGPMTIQEIAEFSGMGKIAVQSLLSTTRKGGKSSYIFRIAAWVWVEGQGNGWKPA